MSFSDRIRSSVTTQVELIATAAMTVLTTDKSFDVSNFLNGYSSAIILTSVVANASADPGLYLDVSYDNSTFTQYATLHSDFTTTANRKYVSVSVLPKYSKLRFAKSSTTTHCTVKVRAILHP